MKLLLKIVLWVIALIALLMMVFFAINWRDEPLRPDVAIAMDWKPSKASLQDNGYLTLVGIESPLEQDATTYGLDLVQVELLRYEDTKHALEEPMLKLTKTNPYIDWKALRCDYTQAPNCLAFYQQLGEHKLAFLLSSQDRLLARYKVIKQSRQWVELVPPIASALIPNYTELMHANELGRVQAIVYFQQQQDSKGFEVLLDNARFSRRLLNGSSTLISYMVALNMLQRDARIISELIAQNPSLAKQHYTTIQAILAPISSSSDSMKQAFAYERAVQLGVSRALKKEFISAINQSNANWQTWLASKLYQPNATANLFYDMATLPMILAVTKPHELDNEATRLDSKRRELLGVGLGPYYIKNPIGKVLASIATLNYQHYIERHFDTEGYLTLVRLQHALMGKNVTEQEGDAIRSQHINPYTQQAMEYDAANQVVRFAGRQPSLVNFNKSTRYQLAIGSPQ